MGEEPSPEGDRDEDLRQETEAHLAAAKGERPAYRQPGRMRVAFAVAIAIHAAVLLLVHPSLRVRLEPESEPGPRIDITLAPGAPVPKTPPATISRAPSQFAVRPRAAAGKMSPAPTIAATHAMQAGTGTSAQQTEQTPVMTAQTNEPPVPTNAAGSPENQTATSGGRPSDSGPAGMESVDRDSAGGNAQVGADDAAAIVSYVNRLTREMRRASQRNYTSPEQRKVRVQIALDRGAPSVRILGSSDIREFDQLSVAAANRALVAVKAPLELFDKRFRFAVCVQFNAPADDDSYREDDARPGKRDRDGVLDVVFEHGVHCDTAVAMDDDNEAQKGPPLDPGLARYRDELLAEVKKLWFYPSAAHTRQRSQGDLEGTVAVQIASDGGIPLARASYSTINRYPELNDAAEVIAKHAIAAVVIPAELQGKPFTFEVPIDFKSLEP
jgi:hypothetical protein